MFAHESKCLVAKIHHSNSVLRAQQNRTLFINHFPPTPSTGIPPSPPDHPPLTNSSPASGHSEPEQDSTVRSSSEKLYIKHLCPSVDDIRHSTEGTLEHFLEGSLSALRESLPGLEASEMEGLRLVEGLKCDFRLALKEHGDDYTSLMDLEERIIHILYTICSIQLHHALVLSLIYRLEK
jgi:hypothetical protein